MGRILEQLWGTTKVQSADINRAKVKELWIPDENGVLTKVLITAEDLNNLAITTRKFMVYSTVALSKGDLLHIAGYEPTNDVFIVEKADADTTGKQAQLIASEDNPGNETSLASDIEELTNLNTNAGNVGDPVYLSTTAAGWTLTAPTGADQVVQVVGRIKVKSETVGKIVFNLVKSDLVKVGTSGLQASSITRSKLSGGFSKVTVADGTNTGVNVIVSGMAVGDELVSVLVLTTKASIGTLADRTSEYAVGNGVLVKSAGTDERNNQLIIIWNDLT